MLTQLNRSRSNQDLEATGKSKLSIDIISRFVLITRADNLESFTDYLRTHPELMDAPLDKMQQTALMIAITYDAHTITQFLLRVGAKRDLRNRAGNAALDYAIGKKNETLIKQLSIPAVLPPLFKHLRACVHEALKQHALNTQINDILLAVLEHLDKFDYALIAYHTIARQFDLYYTAQGIVDAVRNAHDDESLVNNFSDFFGWREQALRGDDHDYCYNETQANHLCYQVAFYLQKNQKPLNLLWHNALTQQRTQPWYNFQDLSVNLNDLTHHYIRTKDNKIQIYSSTVEKAIASLQRGNDNPADIWLCLDSESPNTPAPADLLEILRQRSDSLSDLITYSQMLNNARQQKIENFSETPIYNRFVALRQGLMQGSVSPKLPAVLKDLLDKTPGKATEAEAGTKAYHAIAVFLEWWNTLGTQVIRDEENNLIVTETQLQKNIRQISLLDGYEAYTIDHVLNALWHHRHPAAVNSTANTTVSCAYTVGQYLEKMLASEAVKSSMFKLQNARNVRMDNKRLAELHKKINTELATRSPREFNFGSIFKFMSRFLQLLPVKSLKQLDYSFFANHNLQLFQANLTDFDVFYLNSVEDLRIAHMIYTHPKLIPCHPKLSLMTALIYHRYQTPDNHFHTAMQQQYCLKPYVELGVQMTSKVFRPKKEGDLPAWIFRLYKLSLDYYGKILLMLADQKKWDTVWDLLDLQYPANAVMDALLQKIMQELNIKELSQWRVMACRSTDNPYRTAIIDFWKQAILQPALLNKLNAWVLTHTHYPELEEIFLRANSQAAWQSLIFYAGVNGWQDFEGAFTIKLFKKALAFDVYTAAELLKPLQNVFRIAAPAAEKILVDKLADYCDRRLAEKTDSGYFWYSFWGYHKGMSEQIKLAAAIKKIISICDDSIAFTIKEHQALQDSRLGRIVWWNSPAATARPRP